MRDFNKVNPSLWGSKKFMSLSNEDKVLYLYFLTCPHSNSAGLFRCPIGYISSDLDMKRDSVIKGIDRVCDSKLIAYDKDEETVLLRQWFRFNPPSNPKHAKKVFGDIITSADSDIRSECLQSFSDVLKEKGWDIPDEVIELLEGYRKGIDRVSPQDETRQDIDKTETRQDETQNGGGDMSSVWASQAVELYNQLAEEIGLPTVQKLTSRRKAKLLRRLDDCNGIDGWKHALQKIKQTPGLRGKNEKNWKADFDFILQESSFVKLMEGKYDGWDEKSKSDRTKQEVYEWATEE